MVSLIDSAAQFSQRLQDLSVSDGLRRSLKQAGLVTYGGMAYAHGQPGQPIDDAAFEQWIFQNVMQNATVADLSNAKRILFESQTLVFAALKESLTVPEPSSTKRIPPMERETRMAQLRNRLQGLLIEGPLEPLPWPPRHLRDNAAPQRNSLHPAREGHIEVTRGAPSEVSKQATGHISGPARYQRAQGHTGYDSHFSTPSSRSIQ